VRISPSAQATVDSPIAAAAGLAGLWAGPGPLLDCGQAAPPYPPAESVAEHVAATAHAPGSATYLGGAGLPRLREAFAADVTRDYGSVVTAADVVVTAGCNQAFCLVMAALAQAGDEVVLVRPVYFNHDMWLRMQGIRPVYLDPGPALVPTVEAAAELVGPRTRAIVLVTPGNPTGASVPPARIAELAGLAAQRGIALVVDETYRSFRDDPASPPHELFADPAWGDTLVSLHSFSKDLAIPGYRVGAVVASAAVNRQVLKALDCVAISAPRIGQEAAWAGLTTAVDWRAERVREVAACRARFAAAMAARPGGFELLACGGFFAWVRHPFTRPTPDVVRELVRDHGVLTIPGTAFEPGDHATLRVSVSNLDEPRLTDLVERLRRAGV
jgi:aspartate/methionine/tyrosine aminotransferase